MDELKKLLDVYQREIGHAPEILALALSSRKNLCIHPEVSGACSQPAPPPPSPQVSREEEGKLVDSKCHKLTASFAREKRSVDSSVPLCLFYEVCVRAVGGRGERVCR